ncbi:MAG: hypothetical protein WCP70_03335 [Methanothrix sp.]
MIWTALSFGSQIAAQTVESLATSVNSAEAPSLLTTIIVTSQVQPGASESLTSTVVVTGSTSPGSRGPR